MPVSVHKFSLSMSMVNLITPFNPSMLRSIFAVCPGGPISMPVSTNDRSDQSQ